MQARIAGLNYRLGLQVSTASLNGMLELEEVGLQVQIAHMDNRFGCRLGVWEPWSFGFDGMIGLQAWTEVLQ